MSLRIGELMQKVIMQAGYVHMNMNQLQYVLQWYKLKPDWTCFPKLTDFTLDHLNYVVVQ